MKKIIISAVSLNNVIGRDNILPWENKEEIKYFKEATINQVVLMGRRTYDSIGKPLHERINLVVSRSIQVNEELNDLFYFTSISDSIKFANILEVEKVFIIGGSEIFAQTINNVDELWITRMPFEIEGNKYFPSIKSECWKLVESKEYNSFIVERYSKI